MLQAAGAVRVAHTVGLNEHTEQERRVQVRRRTVEAWLQQKALVVPLAADTGTQVRTSSPIRTSAGHSMSGGDSSCQVSGSASCASNALNRP